MTLDDLSRSDSGIERCYQDVLNRLNWSIKMSGPGGGFVSLEDLLLVRVELVKYHDIAADLYKRVREQLDIITRLVEEPLWRIALKRCVEWSRIRWFRLTHSERRKHDTR